MAAKKLIEEQIAEGAYINTRNRSSPDLMGRVGLATSAPTIRNSINVSTFGVPPPGRAATVDCSSGSRDSELLSRRTVLAPIRETAVTPLPEEEARSRATQGVGVGKSLPLLEVPAEHMQDGVIGPSGLTERIINEITDRLGGDLKGIREDISQLRSIMGQKEASMY